MSLPAAEQVSVERQATEQYEDAVRLDAFAPDDARQAFLEGYVRAALANYRAKVMLGLDQDAGTSGESRDPAEQQPDAVSFLRARMESALRYDIPRCTGISSDALAIYGTGGPEPQAGDYPADRGDLAACERTWVMAPDDVRERMLPVLEAYRVHVEARWAS